MEPKAYQTSHKLLYNKNAVLQQAMTYFFFLMASYCSGSSASCQPTAFLFCAPLVDEVNLIPNFNGAAPDPSPEGDVIAGLGADRSSLRAYVIVLEKKTSLKFGQINIPQVLLDVFPLLVVFFLLLAVCYQTSKFYFT